MCGILRASTVGFMVCLTLVQTFAAEPQDYGSRREAWQTALDNKRFQFPKHYSESMGGFNVPNDSELHVIMKSNAPWEWRLKFVRNGQELLSLPGNSASAFTSLGNTLFFADYSVNSAGCTVSAYDLSSGKQLWQTELHQSKPDDATYREESYSGNYLNRVMIRTSRPGEIEGGIAGAAIVITGKETHCDYVEVLDSKTGKLLAVKNYRVLKIPEPKDKVARQKAWREVLDSKKFSFPPTDEYSGLNNSLGQYNADCKIYVIYGPHMQCEGFKFVRDGREVLSVPGHSQSAFTTVDNKLYFAKYPPVSTGCTVVAYDLLSGKQLWETVLHFPKVPGHSAYGNRVMLWASRAGEIQDGVAGAAIVVTGRESYYDYVNVLDRQTGVSLAVKYYRNEFGTPQANEFGTPPAAEAGFGGEQKGAFGGEQNK